MIYLQGFRPFLIFFFCLSSYLPGIGQPTLDPDLKKPAKYENRILRAEKTGEKKFTLPRRFFQNTYTHYNYEFNARTKLEQVLASAKEQHTDKYSELLNFYNYTLETTALQSTELDSVIYKVNAGIFLHDLRSNRMDDLYLLMGQAYYFRNTLDTAFMTFQYMNYAFSPKEDDGYDKVIGSNANEGGNALKVSTPENRNLVKRAFSPPPGRNDALIWLIRTHIAREDMVSAATLIQTLRNDPDLPARLAPELAEVTAYWFYKRPEYDSSAYYLAKALPAAVNKQERARWEYLMGQLYAKAGKSQEAKAAFEACITHTLNPVMEVAARLQANQQTGGLTDTDWKTASEALEKMAKKERYTSYRDLIYYTLGQIDTRHNKIQEANAHLVKSIYYSQKTSEQRSKSYLLLADNSYTLHQYAQASAYYDSVQTESLNDTLSTELVERMAALKELAPFYVIIARQDSLQALAALPEAERNTLLKKRLRQLRKNEVREEAMASTAIPVIGGLIPNGKTAPADLFASGNSGTDWYFYNKSLKSRGFTEFRSKWGDRPNTDNWRRSSNNAAQRAPEEEGITALTEDPAAPELSLQSLLDQLPLTPEKLALSNDSIMVAKFSLALGIQNKLEDYATAAGIYESLLEKFSRNDQEADILYNLAYCYRKLGRSADLTKITHQLSSRYPQSRQAKLITDPKGVEEADKAKSREATAAYNAVYNLFIEGKFEEAIAEKSKADSLYGKNYWTPQLLYIEALYEIKTRQDEQAITTLNQINSQFPGHALSAKAENMIGVLKRRTEIEDYLSKLEIEGAPADSIKKYPEIPAPKKAVVVTAPEISKKLPPAPVAVVPRQKPADNNKIQKQAPVEKAVSIFSRNPKQPQFVAIVLNQVDPVYVNESRNAFNRYNREKYYNMPMNVVIFSISDEEKIVAVSGLASEEAALQYIKEARELAPREIIPWLKSDKYFFMPVSQDNMDLLMSTRNLPAYLDFLAKEYQGLFPINKH